MESFSNYRNWTTLRRSQEKMKFKVLTILLILGFSHVRAQRIDSLQALLNLNTGIDRYIILYELAYEYVDVDKYLAVDYGRMALEAAKEHGDSLIIVKAGRIMAQAFDGLGKVDSTILLSNQILPMAIKNNYENELIRVLNLLGLSYTYEAEYDQALKYHFQSLQIRERQGDVGSIGISLANIGLVYYKMKDYHKALFFYKKSLTLKNKVKSDIGITLVNISLCYSYINDFKNAKEYIERAFNSCHNICPRETLVSAHYSLGVTSMGLKDFKRAESEFLRSYHLSKELEDKRLLLDNIVFLSKIYIRNNQLKLAERYLREGQELIKDGVPYNLELIKVYNELFTLYSKSKNYEKVAAYQGLYIQLKDSIYSEELTRNLMKIEADYSERENNARIASQNKIMALNNEVIFRQQVLNVFAVIVVLLLAALTFILLKRNRYKKKMNLLLEQKVKERTVEMERSQNMLHESLAERTMYFEKMSNEIKSSLSSINGLCSLGLRDINNSEAELYFNKIFDTSDRLLNVVNRPKINSPVLNAVK